MNKIINLNDSIYEINNKYPEIKEILYNLGFTDIVKPGMINTAGRFMTLKKGSQMKKIDLNLIKDTLDKNGYTVEE